MACFGTMVARARPTLTSPERGFVRWLGYALVLHAGALLVLLASSATSVHEATPPWHRTDDADVSFDVVEEERPAPAALAPGTAVPAPLPVAAARAAARDHAMARRSLDESHATKESGPAGPAAPLGGLGTISNGTGFWPESIPHHLGRITGSRHGGVAVWGDLPEAGLRRRVSEHSPGIRRCYDDGRISVPNLAGRAIMRLLIERDGHVERVDTMGSDLPSKSVLRCLERLFRDIRFPEPESGTVMVTYPLPLSSTQSPDWGTVP